MTAVPRTRSRLRRGLLVSATTIAIGAAAALTAPATASAESLAGEWAPYGDCPVDAPAMLAADGSAVVATCLAGTAPNGTIKLGNDSMPVGAVNFSFGVLNQRGTYTLAVPANGGLTGDPVTVPGGMLGLMCPSDIPVISDICDAVVDSPLNTVTATIETAGTPRDFDLSAATTVGRPIMTMPVKIRLRNPLLRSSCYIGSNSNPILLKVANTVAPAAAFSRFDADGTPSATGEMSALTTSGGALNDSTFAVPAAKGCDFVGLIDSVLNSRQGLPAASGTNNLTLNSASFRLGGFQNPRAHVPNQGKVLSDRWHAAIVD
ncbi:hypothetical protein [Actinophytocola sediminis]